MAISELNEMGLSKREQKKIINFFPEGCAFYWNGKGPPPDNTLLIFNLHKYNNGYCLGCGRDYCEQQHEVRLKKGEKKQ